MSKINDLYRAKLIVGKQYYINDSDTDNPKLCVKMLADGRLSLFMEFYIGFNKVYDESKDRYVSKKIRKREFLKRYLFASPRTPIERTENKNTLELAQKIRNEKSEELKGAETGFRLKKKTSVNFLEYFQKYLDNYTKKDVRMIALALNRFKSFLNETNEYKCYSKLLKPEFISPDMMEAFTEYLQSRSRGEGAKSIYQRFKKVIDNAIVTGKQIGRAHV